MTIEEKIIKIITEQVGERVHANSNIIDAGADSLDAVEIIMEVEEAFEIEISDEDADKFKTVGDIVNYITRRIGE